MIGVLLVLWIAPPTVVLVTGAAPAPEPARVEAARDQLRTRFRVIDGPRDALEGYAAPPSPEEATRDALERAHQCMRRFDLPGVRQALAEARQAAVHLSPSDEGRRLAAVVALREAELALVAHDRPAGRRAAAFALSIDPSLTPDPQRVPPQVVELIAQTRQAEAKHPRIRVRVETTPPGGRVIAGEHVVGTAPMEIEVPQGPMVAWATREGSVPTAIWTDARADATVAIQLEPLDDAARLRPLVSNLRQAAPDHRRSAALALADALGVDAVAVIDAGEPVIYQRRVVAPEPALQPAPALALPVREPPSSAPAPRPPVYKRAWFWAVVGGVAVASAGAMALYYFSQPETVSYTCCR